MVRLLSVNVGLPREVTWNSRTVRTAVWKFPQGQRNKRYVEGQHWRSKERLVPSFGGLGISEITAGKDPGISTSQTPRSS